MPFLKHLFCFMVSEDSVRGRLVVCFGLTAVGVEDRAVSSRHGCPEHILAEHLCSADLLLFPLAQTFQSTVPRVLLLTWRGISAFSKSLWKHSQATFYCGGAERTQSDMRMCIWGDSKRVFFEAYWWLLSMENKTHVLLQMTDSRVWSLWPGGSSST